MPSRLRSCVWPATGISRSCELFLGRFTSLLNLQAVINPAGYGFCVDLTPAP